MCKWIFFFKEEYTLMFLNFLNSNGEEGERKRRLLVTCFINVASPTKNAFI